jgi:hypothetical protein
VLHDGRILVTYRGLDAYTGEATPLFFEAHFKGNVTAPVAFFRAMSQMQADNKHRLVEMFTTSAKWHVQMGVGPDGRPCNEKPAPRASRPLDIPRESRWFNLSAGAV